MPYSKPRPAYPAGSHAYIYKITEDFHHQTDWTLDAPFEAQWLAISCAGLITVKANATGYAWDGCSPKWSVLDLCVVGTPDGQIDLRTGKPYTYYATLVHDVLYQYFDSVPVPKSAIDTLFLQMMDDFKLRKLYYYPVKWWAGWGVVQHGVLAAAHKR